MATQSASPHNLTDDATSTSSALLPTEQPTNDDQPTAEPPKKFLQSLCLSLDNLFEKSRSRMPSNFSLTPELRDLQLFTEETFLRRKGLLKKRLMKPFVAYLTCHRLLPMVKPAHTKMHSPCLLQVIKHKPQHKPHSQWQLLHLV